MTSLEDDVSMTLEFDEESWRPGWLRVMDERPYVVFDCSGDPLAPVPVWPYDYSFPLPTRPVFASIGEMVEFWIELIDTGDLSWDSAHRRWRLRDGVSHAILNKVGGVPHD